MKNEFKQEKTSGFLSQLQESRAYFLFYFHIDEKLFSQLDLSLPSHPGFKRQNLKSKKFMNN